MPDWKELTGEDTPLEKAEKKIKMLERQVREYKKIVEQAYPAAIVCRYHV